MAGSLAKMLGVFYALLSVSVGYWLNDIFTPESGKVLGFAVFVGFLQIVAGCADAASYTNSNDL